MALLKTVACFAYVVLAVVGLMPLGLLAALLSLAGLRGPMSALMYRIAQGWARGLIAMTGCRVAVRGREGIPRSGGVCFVSNHDSIADTLMLLAYAGRPIGFIAKRELRRVPLLNVWISVLGGLFIDRDNPRSALRTINAGVARLKAGGAMIVFPEGSRSRGRGLLPFRPGALKLAAQSGAAIVPVAISGTYELFEKSYRATACDVGVAFCEPIMVADVPAGDRKAALAERVRGVIGEALGGPGPAAADSRAGP